MKKFRNLTSSELFTINGGSINPIIPVPILPIRFTSWLIKKFRLIDLWFLMKSKKFFLISIIFDNIVIFLNWSKY